MGYLTPPTDPPDWCPGCEPELDQTKKVVLEKWCRTHAPDRGGPDDEQMLRILGPAYKGTPAA